MGILLMDNIPLDCLSIIFSFVPLEYIPSLLFLCKRFTNVLQKDSLWKIIFVRNVDKKHIIHPELMTDGQWKRATLKNFSETFHLEIRNKIDLFYFWIRVEGEKFKYNYIPLRKFPSGKKRYVPISQCLDKDIGGTNGILYYSDDKESCLNGAGGKYIVPLLIHSYHHTLEKIEELENQERFAKDYVYVSRAINIDNPSLLSKVNLSPKFRYLE